MLSLLTSASAMFTGAPLKKTAPIFQSFSRVLLSGYVKTRAVFWLKKKKSTHAGSELDLFH